MRHLSDWLALALLAPVGLAACGGGSSSSGDAIPLGAIMSVSGNKAQPGQGELQSIQMAVDQINEAGGINGRRLMLVNRDDHSGTDGAKAAAADLITNVHATAIFGTTAPETTLSAAQVTIPADTILISDIASGPSLNDLADNDTVFTTAPDRTVQGAILAQRAWDKGFRKCAVLYVELPLHTETASGFRTKFKALGGTITTDMSFSQTETSYSPMLQQVYGADTPDCILVNAEAPEGTQVMKDYLSTYASKQTFWFFNPAMGNPDFFQGLGYGNFTFRHEGIDVADGPGIDAYTKAFDAKYPGTTVEYEPGSYDDVYLVALAMQASGKTDADSIKANIRAINDPAGTKVGPGEFAKAVSILKAGGKVNYEGASGSCDLDAKGAALATSLIWAIVNGEYKVTVPSVAP
jgi:ABC-type branched-subunit amino acid transport system substrate-binding protein